MSVLIFFFDNFNKVNFYRELLLIFRVRWKSIYLAFALVVEKIGYLAEWHDVRESLDAGGSAGVQKRDAFRIDGALTREKCTTFIRLHLYKGQKGSDASLTVNKNVPLISRVI